MRQYEFDSRWDYKITSFMYRIGHRGASGYALENTAAAINKAIEFKINMIELDVRKCASGEIVICHDKTIDRTTNGVGAISKLSLAKIKNVNTLDGQKILTLQEALDIVQGRCLVNLHLKSSNVTLGVLEILNNAIASKKWSIRHFLLSSFSIRQLKKIQGINPKIKLGLLCYRNTFNVTRRIKGLLLYSIHINRRWLKKKGIQKLRQNGLKVFAWTINNAADIQMVKNLKVDGIISDFPDLI